MADATQYTFDTRELLEMLVRQAEVHEGKWFLLANFGFGASNFGPTPDTLAPGAFAVINYLGIQRAGPDTPEGMIVDAAEINPQPTPSKRRTAPRSQRPSKT